MSAPTTAATSSAGATRRDIVANRPLMTLMLGHFTVDMYAGVLPLLYPLLTDKFDLSFSTVGLVSLAYSGVAAISQPLFGLVADRKGTRLIGLTLMWTGFMFATLGFASSFTMLIALAALAGFGSGAYHPMGALGAGAVIPPHQRNVAMSIYVMGGTLGVAVGPVVGALVFHFFGLSGTAALVIPGAGISLWMIAQMRVVAAKRGPAQPRVAPLPIPLGPMAVIIGLMMLRSWTLFGIQSFIPTWYKNLGYSSAVYSGLATTILLTSALGTIGSGSLADRRGRKLLLVLSSIAGVPAILLFAQFPGYPAFVSAALIGLLAASTGPLLLVMAQQLMVGRAGVASGLILGLGFVMGAIGVPVMGLIGDHWGLQNAFRTQAIVALAAVLLSLALPSEARMNDLTTRDAPATAAA